MRPSQSPEVLFVRGRILTGNGLPSGKPEFVEALLVRDGCVLLAGDTQALETAAPIGTTRVDLGGAFTMPGFNDAHLHLGEGARLRREVDLSGAPSLAAALARIASAAERTPSGGWITGGGWDESLWPGSPLPTRYDLDRVTGGHPAVFARVDVHLSVANSAALRLSGVGAQTQAPSGSALDCDAHGQLTGILREAPARALVERHIPSATRQDRIASLRSVIADALRLGVTSVQDNSVDEDVAALHILHSQGELGLRITEWLPFHAPVSELHRRQAEFPGDHLLRAGMLKAFLDGSLGSRTAAMQAPYSDAADQSGLALYEQDQLNAMAIERAAAGFQLGFHAIGDRAVNMALTAFSAVRAAGFGIGMRPRIEHAQTAAPGAFQQANALGAIASMQPNHLLSDLRWVGARLGVERAARAYAWRSFLDTGVPLAFGTDYPVEPINPLRGLYAAVTREPEKGGTPFYPEQQLTLGQALHAATQGSAWAEGTERWKGRLAPGYVADFVVLDLDPFQAVQEDARSLLDTKVLRTVVGGRTLYAAP